jgi:proline-specific peptidase
MISGEYVLINGIKQYFFHISNTNKEVIIMLHGGPGSPNSYLAYHHQPYLNFCNVVYYDQRGAGKTQLKNKTKPENISIDILIDDLKQTIQHIKGKYETDRVFLLGHSWGTMLGKQYIIKHPTDVAGYIGHGQVISTATQDRSWYEYLKKATLQSGKKSDIKKIDSINKNYPNISRDEFTKATFLIGSLGYKYGYKTNDWIKILRKSPIMTFRDMLQMARGGKSTQKLIREVFYQYDIRNVTEYQVPVYYVLGRQDEWTSSTIAAEYFDSIQAPKKKLYWIEKAGHMTDTDNPSDFFNTIKEIITQSC